MCNIIITTTGKVVKIQGGKLKMKKFLAIALALVFVLGLAACSDSQTTGGGDSTEKGEVSVFYYTYSDTEYGNFTFLCAVSASGCLAVAAGSQT